MDNDKKGFIRYLKNTEKMCISAIAKRLGADRKTVRRALTEVDDDTKRKKRPSKLDPFKERIENILAEHPTITNTLILEKIKAEGYEGGRSILGEYLLEVRRQSKEAYHHIETLPAAEAQVDWASVGSICCGEYNRKLYVFCMVLSYSRYMYMALTTSMDTDTFMACHIQAFRYFGGVAKSLLYDNLKTVVSFRHGNQIIYNERFADFASYYGFKIKVCNLRRGNEKGKVERAIRYIKDNFINRQRYDNYDQIKALARFWLRETANRRLHSTTRQKPEAMFLNQEKARLLILPPTDYDYAAPRPVKLRKDCLFTFETNRYSIPAEYYQKPLFFKAYTHQIKVVCAQEVIACHRRCYDKHQTIKNPAHYTVLNARKKKARQSASIDQFKRLCPEAERYLSGLMKHQIDVHYHIKQILDLEQIFDSTAIAGAVAHALSFEAFHWEFIKNILFNTQQIAVGQKPVITDKKALMDIRVKPPQLSDYDKLTGKGDKP